MVQPCQALDSISSDLPRSLASQGPSPLQLAGVTCAEGDREGPLPIWPAYLPLRFIRGQCVVQNYCKLLVRGASAFASFAGFVLFLALLSFGVVSKPLLPEVAAEPCGLCVVTGIQTMFSVAA